MSFVLLQCAWLISYSVATCGSARHWQRPTCVTRRYTEVQSRFRLYIARAILAKLRTSLVVEAKLRIRFALEFFFFLFLTNEILKVLQMFVNIF